MELLGLAAAAHADGNRIDLSWAAPRDAEVAVTVVRRQGTYPTTHTPGSPAEGVVLEVDEKGTSFVDSGLKGETVYYYRVFPFERAADGSPTFLAEPPNVVSAMATSPAGLAEEMYALLPAIFRRYDERDQLRRFLELPGSQLDQLYSYATALLGALDVGRVDGTFLELLADWIGWRTDHSIELASQRSEVRNAPALYHAVGLVPAIGATVQRIARQPSRVKEFVHNVALTNNPSRFTLWELRRTGATWDPEPAQVSVDAAFGGRPALELEPDELEPDGAALIAYEHHEDGRSSLRLKRLRDAWEPSERFEKGPPTFGARAIDYRDPSLAWRKDPALGPQLVLYASAYLPASRQYRVAFWERVALPGTWSGTLLLELPGVDPNFDCRRPVTVTDGDGYLLFFLQLDDDGRWVLKFNRHDGTDFQAASSVEVPGGIQAEEVFALVHPTDAQRRLWLFWASQLPLDPNADASQPQQTRWRISYRVKASTDPNVTNDWGPIQTLPPAADKEHDREPCALVNDDKDIELFWSSHRGGRWSIWRGVIKRTTAAFGTAAQLSVHDGAMRAPLAFRRGAATVAVFRSNQSIPYRSDSFSAAETVDFRYAGTTTYHTREAALKLKRGLFDDAGAYLYDTGRGDGDRYARDTIGVYVPPGADPDALARTGRLLREFMPATDRAVFVKES
jgi:phage tail-like protein